MPTHLRSGSLKDAPKKKYVSPYSIFYEERSKHHHDLDGPARQKVISEEYDRLDNKKLSHYENLYDKHLKEFKEQLLVFYGGANHKSKLLKQEIPPKPKKPISIALRYAHDIYPDLCKEFPDEDRDKLRDKAHEMFRNIPQKELTAYQKRYDSEYDTYKKEKEEWTKKYGKVYEEQQEMLENHMKRSAQKDDTGFVYQELVPVKRPRVKKVNEEEETRPVKEVKMKKKYAKK